MTTRKGTVLTLNRGSVFSGTLLSWHRDARSGTLRGFLRDDVTGVTLDFSPADLDCRASELRPARKVLFETEDGLRACHVRLG